MIHYTQIIWEEVAFIWKVTGKAVAIFMTSTVCQYSQPHLIGTWLIGSSGSDQDFTIVMTDK